MFVELHQSKSIFSMKTHTREHKVVVVGPRKVGKSALVVRFLTKRFINEYVENTDMQCIRVADVDGEPLKVHIQDTCDKAMRTEFLEHQLKWADAIMLVYSISDIEGFHQLNDMASKIIERNRNKANEERENNSLPPLVLVGNKGDLDFLRKVSQQEGFQLASKLQCDFFETSAREGWSKQITKRDSLLPSADSDSISLVAGVAGAAGSIGVLGFPCRDVTKGFARSLTPTLSRRKSQMKTHYSDHERSPELSPVRRWGSFNSLNRIGVDRESNQRTFPVTSDEDVDEHRTTETLLLPRGRKLQSHSSLISKLSPRLSRRTPRTHNTHTQHTHNTRKQHTHGLSSEPMSRKQLLRGDNNNNNHFKSKPVQNSIAFGLSTTFLTSGSLGESLKGPASIRSRLGSHSTNSSSCENSATSSDCGSHENLNFEKQTAEPPSIRNTPSASPCSEDFPVVIEPLALQERSFSTSEPFLCICRGKMSRSRVRSRSPTNKIVSSFKKIRTRADQRNHSAAGFQKQHQLLPNTSNLLAVPIIKF